MKNDEFSQGRPLSNHCVKTLLRSARDFQLLDNELFKTSCSFDRMEKTCTIFSFKGNFYIIGSQIMDLFQEYKESLISVICHSNTLF